MPTVISIPIILISRVQIDFKRKIVIGTILSLSAAMIATALIRLFPPTMHILSIDGPWYFFWEAVESSLAVLMVSITSFKSIYGASNNQSSNSSRPSITPLSKVKDSINSRMSKIFVRNGKSDPSTMQSFEEFSSNPPAGRIQDGRYFELETPKEHTSDPEKGFGNHTNVVSQITVREQIDVELSERSASDLSSVSTKAFSPMSPKNPATSPSSTRLDPQSPESWNMGGKH